MKNKLTDLNNHLFTQLERLNEEGLEGDKLADEIARAKAITSISSQIISNGNLVLEANKFKAETLGRSKTKMPDMLEDTNE